MTPNATAAVQDAAPVAPSLPQQEEMIGSALAEADIRINGDRPWDIRVHDPRLYGRVLSHGSMGLGESYMDGWWDCDALDEFFERIFQADLDTRVRPDLTVMMQYVSAYILNVQSLRGSRAVAERHYDLGNAFFAAMLDPYMQYTCAYFSGTEDLAEAQRRKLDLICRKLDLQPDHHVLDMGCGWGGLAKFMAQTRGARVTGVNISKAQVAFGRAFNAGLPVEILESDYRNVEGMYDRITAIGMMEHVGTKNYRGLMEIAHEHLRDDGLFLVHTIGTNVSTRITDPWIERYIFPHSVLPSASQIMEASEGLFVMEDWHNFGASYDKTLMAWNRNFEEHWSAFEAIYGERFRRMWRYYLLSCAAAFRTRRIQLWQIVFSKEGVPGGYRSVQ